MKKKKKIKKATGIAKVIREVTLLEGKKKSVDIAQVSEIFERQQYACKNSHETLLTMVSYLCGDWFGGAIICIPKGKRGTKR